MDWPGKRAGLISALLIVCALAGGGCAHFSLPRIDPSGERIFLPVPASTKLTCPCLQHFHFPKLPTPAYTAPPPTPACAGPPALPPPAAPILLPRQLPGAVYPGPAATGREGVLVMTPARVIAPVGSEVVLMAGLCGTDGFYRTKERIEWMLSQESVGHFVQVGDEKRGYLHRLRPNSPQKLSSDYAIGRTSTRSEVLTRGTPTAGDDVLLAEGLAWISVVSATEGVSHVTALAPDAAGWDGRQQAAAIHWVDAQWALPSPAILRAGGRHTLTTTLTRSTSARPIAGWTVRYELVDGPAAGFAPNGATAIEVITDAFGKASAEMIPKSGQPGTARIRIQIIRPATSAGDLSRLNVGQGWSSITWSAPGLSVRTTGPDRAEIGSTVTYRVDLSNTGDMSARDVVLSDTLPTGISYLGSNPPGQVFGNRIEWRLGDLAAKTSRRIEINCRVGSGGSLRHCVTARSAEGLTAEGCATTQISRNALSVEMAGPKVAEVGQSVQYTCTVTNRSGEQLTQVKVTNRYGSGLKHAESASPIEKPLGELAPGQSRRFAITFTVTGPGRLCHKLDVTAEGGHQASAQACLTASPVARKPEPSMTVSKTGPQQSQVGQIITFTMQVTNTGEAPLKGVRITDEYAPSLLPTDATKGYRAEGGRLVWDIDELPPGQSAIRKVKCKCQRMDRSACNRVTVTVTGGITMADEACLEIFAAPKTPPQQGAQEHQPESDTPAPTGQLVMTVADNSDPVKVGGKVTYLIIIKNDRTVSDKNIVLAIEAPEGLKFEKIDGGPTSLERGDPSGRKVQLKPIKELRAGESVTIRVQMTATRAGRAVLKAEVNSLRLQSALTEEEDTTVYVE